MTTHSMTLRWMIRGKSPQWWFVQSDEWERILWVLHNKQFEGFPNVMSCFVFRLKTTRRHFGCRHDLFWTPLCRYCRRGRLRSWLGEGSSIPELDDVMMEPDPTLPSTEDVIRKTEQITKNIQELLRAAQENKHDRSESEEEIYFITLGFLF